MEVKGKRLSEIKFRRAKWGVNPIKKGGDVILEKEQVETLFSQLGKDLTMLKEKFQKEKELWQRYCTGLTQEVESLRDRVKRLEDAK